MNHTKTRRTREAIQIDGQVRQCAPALTFAVEAMGTVPQYRFVTFQPVGDTVGAIVPGAVGGPCDAISSTAAVVGEEAELIPEGLCRLEIGQAISSPANLMTNADGKGVPATGSGNTVMAKLLEDSAGDGSVCLVYKYSAGPTVLA